MRLTASLDGPFANVAKLKGPAVGGPHTAAATPIRATARAGGAPVSTLRVPKDATPGFYNLTTSVVSGGGTSSGSAVIRVVSRSH